MMLTAKRFFSAAGAPADLARECEFFSSLKMRNGTFKLTRPSRFAVVEERFAPMVRARVKGPCAVLDIGASTGLTTIELADFLRAQGAVPRVVGTDLFIDAHLVDLAPGVHVLADPDGWPLQYGVAGVGIRAWVRRLDYVTLAVLPRLLARSMLRPRLRRRIAAGASLPVRMESRALVGQAIRLVENDIFVREPSFAARFDFIRAANILNLGYFRPERLRVAIANIHAYSRGPGALLLVVKTDGSKHDGTLFELGPEGDFQVLARIGRGSEIEGLVLEAAAATRQGEVS
ncbi:ATP-binding protein [Kaistia sp. 32K]|uniref:ATP-binding protein n=1 Tax=Kaistia sp. 32K TaxID=2795690 RepID=UPI001916147D|nr:ATP-binding protein [Kaistia sp. 32K]BCP53921.1 ATP-binding protein [Kaistia sp. 32K]